MSLNANATKLTNLINPQVIADMMDKKLIDLIKFSPLCRIDNTLEGRPGSVITLPSYTYIGDAADVAEGADISIGQLTETTATATIKKAGKGVQITDEAILSGYGDPVGEAVSQLQKSIAAKVDKDALTTLRGIAAAMTYTVTTAGTFAADDVADALIKFGEDIEGEKVLIVSPKMYGAFRKADDWCPASEIAANLIIEGAVGMIHGCQVVVSNKINDYVPAEGETPATRGEAFIVKPGALALYLKRDVLVETDRDIINKSNVITADKHYVTYLYDSTKAIKVTI